MLESARANPSGFPLLQLIATLHMSVGLSAAECASLRADYEAEGFAYVRGAVPQEAMDALAADLWKQAEAKTAMHWNGAPLQLCGCREFGRFHGPHCKVACHHTHQLASQPYVPPSSSLGEPMHAKSACAAPQELLPGLR